MTKCKVCEGCGAVLQTFDKNKEGFVKRKMIEEARKCERCFKISNYGEQITVVKEDEFYSDILRQVNNTNDLVVYVMDVLDVGKFNDIIRHLNNPFILAVTKVDLIPKSVKPNKLKAKIKEECDLDNNIRTCLISSNKNIGCDELYKVINQHKLSKDVYFIGKTNSGKSTLINKLMKNYSEWDSSITTSHQPNTTLNLIRTRLNDELTLVDTPGIIDDSSLTSIMDIKALKRIMPKKEIKPITYQLKTGKTISIDNLMRMEYVEGELNSFTFYMPNQVKIERINTITNLTNKKLPTRIIEVKSGQDVCINGLGWIKVVKSAKLLIYIDERVKITVRNALI